MKANNLANSTVHQAFVFNPSPITCWSAISSTTECKSSLLMMMVLVLVVIKSNAGPSMPLVLVMMVMVKQVKPREHSISHVVFVVMWMVPWRWLTLTISEYNSGMPLVASSLLLAVGNKEMDHKI